MRLYSDALTGGNTHTHNNSCLKNKNLLAHLTPESRIILGLGTTGLGFLLWFSALPSMCWPESKAVFPQIGCTPHHPVRGKELLRVRFRLHTGLMDYEPTPEIIYRDCLGQLRAIPGGRNGMNNPQNSLLLQIKVKWILQGNQ